MMSLFRNPINPDGLQNAQIRKKWDNKKFVLRFSFAVFASVLVVIGLELATPNYSVTNTIVEHVVEKSETLRAFVESEWLRDVFVKGVDPDKSLPIYSGSSLKFSVFALVFLLVSLHFLSNDPLSNSEMLRNLVKKSKPCRLPTLFRWMGEIRYYAKNLPSNRLPERCAGCGTSGCGNRLAHGLDANTYHWNSIFAKLSSLAVNNMLYYTHRCRTIFFLRYSLWLAAVVLLFAYSAARLVELYLGRSVDSNFELVSYIVVLWVLGFVVGGFNSARYENARGVWGQFSENVGNLFHSQDFKEIFGAVVCQYDQKSNRYSERDRPVRERVSGSEIQRLVTLINYLDDVVKKKAVRALGGNNVVGDKESLRAIITALVEMLFVINQEEVAFRSALFILSEDQQYLAPLVSVPFGGQPFLTLCRHDYMSDKLALDSDSIASRAWQTRRAISARGEDIPYFHEGQARYLRSMMAVPLVIDSEMRNLAAKLGEDVGEIVGVVTIDCDGDSYFSPDSHDSNLISIMPFMNRIVFEMMYSLVKRGSGDA